MTRTELYKIADTFETIRVNGRTHIIRPMQRGDTRYPLPNYRRTYMALVGILGKEPETGLCYAETLEEFQDRWVKDQFKYRHDDVE